MPDNHDYPVKNEIIDNDRVTLTVLQKLSDYHPANPEQSIAALNELNAALERAVQDEIYAKNAMAAARRKRVAASHALHDGMVRARAYVVSQYGPDSEAVQALSVKRRPRRKRAAATVAAKSE